MVEDQGRVAWFVIAAVREPITIFGHGKQVRDLLHVDDLVAAFQSATEKIDVTKGQVYNAVGRPIPGPWAESSGRREELTGVSRAVRRGAIGGGDQRCCGDVSKAGGRFGWARR